MIREAILFSLLNCYVNPFCLNMSTVLVENIYLENDLIGEQIEASLLDCAASCQSIYGCLSAGFQPETQACHLHTGDSSSASEDLTEQNDWIHVDIQSLSSELLGPCADHNCSAGQKCTVHRVTKQPFCRKADVCPPPPLMPNAIINLGSQMIRSSRTYTCLDGYLDIESSLTSAVTTCLPDNTWSPPNLTCIALEYIGCFEDDWDRLLKAEFKVHRLTREGCIGKCLSLGYTYAGMENKKECYCGNVLDTERYKKKPEWECNVPCAGNRSQICGGKWWRISVFKIHG